ncbi:uncharacterized protein LOC111116359 isoform X1 [Crassostrea virginica]
MTSEMDLSTLMKSVVGHSPYPKKVTVKVLCTDPATTYVNDKKERRELMNTVVADSTKAVKCVVYDSKKFHRFATGSTIILRNIIRKPEGIAVTSATVIFPAAKTLDLPPIIEKEGIAILHPPPADVKSVAEALASPTKTRVSVRGKIVQEEATRYVTVKNEDNVKVKNIYLEDTTKKCKIALWRDLADQPVRPGDYVEVSDCITNTFRNEVSLSTTSKTAITKTECPEETVTVTVLLFCILKISYLIICCRIHYNNGSYLSFVITITVLQLNFYSGIFHWNDNSSIFVRYLLQKFYVCSHS